MRQRDIGKRRLLLVNTALFEPLHRDLLKWRMSAAEDNLSRLEGLWIGNYRAGFRTALVGEQAPCAEICLWLKSSIGSTSGSTVTSQSKGRSVRYQRRMYQDRGEKEGKIYVLGEVVDKTQHPNPAMFAPVTSFDVKPTNSSTIPPILPSPVALFVTPTSTHL